jgi:hypothetical protein
MITCSFVEHLSVIRYHIYCDTVTINCVICTMICFIYQIGLFGAIIEMLIFSCYFALVATNKIIC